jgi:hypothetical protein
MAFRRSISAFGIILSLVSTSLAQSVDPLAPGNGSSTDKPVTPTKRPVVRERGFEVPFDLKTEPDIKFRGSTEGSTPSALDPTSREHRPYIGFGLSRPIDTGK